MERNVKRTYRDNRSRYAANAYVYGNVAVKPEYQVPSTAPKKKTQPAPQKAPAQVPQVQPKNVGFVLYCMAAFVIAAVILIGYLQLNSEVTNLRTEKVKQEKILANMKEENVDALARVENSINLEEIRRIAIQELGMTYPEEGQILSYEGVSYDYVRKVAE